MHKPIPLTRRAAAQTIAGGALALSSFPLLADDEQSVPGKYLLASAMYGTLPLEEVIAEVQKTGAKHLDLWRKPHANHWEQVGERGEDALTTLLKEHDVELGAVTFWKADFENSLRFAARHGANTVVTGFVPKGNELVAFLKNLQPQVKLAEELNVTLAIENHGSSFDDIRRFAEAAKSDQVGVALAPYHLPQDSNELAKLISDLGPKLKLFYAWQHGMGCMKKLPKEQELLQMPGRGDLEFAPLVAALRKIEYTGFIEIFMHPVPRGIPILPTAKEVTAEINRSRNYLESLS